MLPFPTFWIFFSYRLKKTNNIRPNYGKNLGYVPEYITNGRINDFT